MTFYQEMRSFVLGHGAINNPYLDRFKNGDITDLDLKEFATEFYNFARFFPQILVSQLVNTEDEKVADELTRVLYSELGDGQTQHRHELLYRDFLRSIGIDVHEAMSCPMLASTRAYIEGLGQLYSDGNHFRALGASFGLENMAITMWDHLIPGLTHLNATRYPHLDITYFTFHRQLESTHEVAMEHAVEAVQHATNEGMSVEEMNHFRCGVNAVLGYLEGFWMGLERGSSPDRKPQEIHHQAA
jgi:pyrroloquinoline-quinone synthase